MSETTATLDRLGSAEVTGAGGARRRHWDLILMLALTEYRRRYAGSALGYAWTLLRPLMLFAVLYAVFTQVIRFGDSVPSYPVLLLFGITLFLFFQEGTNAGLRAFVARGPIMRNLKMSPLVAPLSAILAAALTFAASLTIALVWILAYGVRPTATWLLLPLLLLWLAVLTISIGVLLSVLFVRFRDVGQAWQPISRLLFYASPILYPFEFIPEGIFRTLAALNPLSPLFVQARQWIIDPDAPGWGEVATDGFQLVAPFVFTVALCALAVLAYRTARRMIPEML